MRTRGGKVRRAGAEDLPDTVRRRGGLVVVQVVPDQAQDPVARDLIVAVAVTIGAHLGAAFVEATAVELDHDPVGGRRRSQPCDPPHRG